MTSVVIILAIYVAVFIAIALNSENLARTLGFSIAIGWLLNEPLLVALIGSTVGHDLCNLRVVDNKTGGNLNVFKGVLRTLLKASARLALVRGLPQRRSLPRGEELA